MNIGSINNKRKLVYRKCTDLGRLSKIHFFFRINRTSKLFSYISMELGSLRTDPQGLMHIQKSISSCRGGRSLSLLPATTIKEIG